MWFHDLAGLSVVAYRSGQYVRQASMQRAKVPVAARADYPQDSRVWAATGPSSGHKLNPPEHATNDPTVFLNFFSWLIKILLNFLFSITYPSFLFFIWLLKRIL